MGITPVVASSELGRGVKLRDVVADLVVHFAELERLDLGMSLGFMNRHVKDAEMQLAQIEHCIIDVLRLDEVLDHLIR